MKFIEYSEELDLDNKIVIGIDETGVGDYFGPLVSCAAFVPKKNKEKVIELGIKDSKKISDKKIQEVAPLLEKLVYYSIHHLSPIGYNNLNKTYNSNELKMFTHLNSVNRLQEHFKKIDYIFIDKYSTTKSIEKYYDNFIFQNNWAKLQPFKVDVVLSNKAEDINLAVAVASVLARNYFLTYMRQMNETFNLDFPFGAGNNVKKFIDENCANKDKSFWKKVAKIHFKMK